MHHIQTNYIQNSTHLGSISGTHIEILPTLPALAVHLLVVLRKDLINTRCNAKMYIIHDYKEPIIKETIIPAGITC